MSSSVSGNPAERTYKQFDRLFSLAKNDPDYAVGTTQIVDSARRTIIDLIETVAHPDSRELLLVHGPDQITTQYLYDSQSVIRCLHGAGEQYRDMQKLRGGTVFPSARTRAHDLRDATVDFQTSPLLTSAHKMVEYYPSERNKAVEGIVRIMHLQLPFTTPEQ